MTKLSGFDVVAVTVIGVAKGFSTLIMVVVLRPTSATISGSTSGGAGSATRCNWYQNSPSCSHHSKMRTVSTQY